MLETGVVLQNRYRIQRRIGGGGMGVVYLADDTRLAGRQCAVKEMSPAQLAPGDRNWAIQAFRQEAQMLANLHHPGLTNVTDFFPEGGNWYLVMEYIQGETLESRLERAPNGRFTLDEALRITRQICEGLPVSAMLSEGAAVSTGMSAVAGEGHLPLRVFCAAYDLAGKLPRVSGNLSYQGHIRDLENYYAAGCFVQYLLDAYGPEKFAQLYPTGDYRGVYGKSLTALESDWVASLAEYHAEVAFEPETLVEAVDAVAAAYEQLFSSFRGTPEEMRAYRVLDGARIALIEGDFPGVDAALTEFRSEPSS
ncbi:MAG: protein kinase [Anaerolineae bacterium]|jgi:hypothetical protein|nr:protein kinase [Anaerolineae bacterium]